MAKLRHGTPQGLPTEGRIEFIPQTGIPGCYWLYIDGTAHSSVNLHDPEALDFEYMQQMAVCLEPWLTGKARALHLGVGAASLIRWAAAKFPQLRQTGFDIEPLLIDNLRTWLELPPNPVVKLRLVDAWEGISTTSAASYNVIVRDVFYQGLTPQQLRTPKFFDHCERVLRPGGLLLCNEAQAGGLQEALPQVRLLLDRFVHVGLISEPAALKKRRYANTVLVATDSDDISMHDFARPLGNLPVRSQIITGRALERLVA